MSQSYYRRLEEDRQAKSKVCANFGPGDVSRCCNHLAEIPSGSKVVLLGRVSIRAQKGKGNLEDQLDRLRGLAKERGLVVVAEYGFTGSGFDPYLYERAVVKAEDEKAVLLAESLDRFMRPSNFHTGNNPDAWLTEKDLRNLTEITRGVPLYTVEKPTSTPGEVRSAQRKRGMHAKGKKGGRATQSRKSYREKWKPLALKLAEEGISVRIIARRITRLAGSEVSHTTISKWINSVSPAREGE